MKRITALLLCAVCAASLTACTDKQEESTASNAPQTVIAEDSKRPSSVVTSVYDNIEIHEGFPAVCSIAYDLGTSKISLIRTDKGIYISSGGSEMMFVKANGVYSTYTKGEDGVFVRADDAQELADGYMKQYISTFSSFCYPHEQNFDEMKKGAQTSVCGRVCTEYTYELKDDASEYKYTYTVDDETGICLKYSLEGTETDGTSGVYEYVCTEFSLTGVKLPEYK